MEVSSSSSLFGGEGLPEEKRRGNAGEAFPVIRHLRERAENASRTPELSGTGEQENEHGRSFNCGIT